MPHSESQFAGLQLNVAGRETRTTGISFDVTVIEHVGRPIAHHVFNQFDEAGLLLSLPRLPGERNTDYKRRLLDVYTRRASATYKGLVYGITRELGLQLYSPFEVFAVQVAGVMSGRNPVIEFDGPEVRIWGDVMLDSAPELTIDRFSMDIGTLVTQINTSLFIGATIPATVDISTERAMRIMDQSTLTVVTAEVLRDNNRNQLTGRNIVEDSIFFSGTNAFRTRVITAEAVMSSGQYFLDRASGLLLSFDAPGPTASTRYRYINDPLGVVASPVILHDVQDRAFKEKLFEQVLLEDGSTTSGLPTALGTDIINELLTVKAELWDE